MIASAEACVLVDGVRVRMRSVAIDGAHGCRGPMPLAVMMPRFWGVLPFEKLPNFMVVSARP